MYKNLSRILNDKGVTTKAIATLLNVTEKTALSKVRGTTELSLGEAVKISSVVCPEYRMEYAFAEDSDEEMKV